MALNPHKGPAETWVPQFTCDPDFGGALPHIPKERRMSLEQKQQTRNCHRDA